QLFDEGIFEDQNYIVQLKKSVIICTSNYRDEDEIRKELGNAIFNRFDVVIGFNELSEEAKLKIAERCISEVQMKYKEEKGMDMPEQYLDNLKTAAVKCRNAREIHHLVSDTFALYYIKQVCGDDC
ncbi:MAG: ATP-dependent Clp protease ATP-binding subunit, partial [Lachnospiraceae bacterium]|nr:ATP-dependent Clp protease ATP-binding subunit [Lachnospiraceae bacterium]